MKARLVLALDYARRKGVPTGSYTYQRDGQWYCCRYGPTFENLYRLSELSEADLAWVQGLARPDPRAGRDDDPAKPARADEPGRAL